MHTTRFGAILCSALVFVSAHAAAQTIDLRLTEIADAPGAPLYLTHAGDGSGRVFVVGQHGVIRVLADGMLGATPFLDLDSLISSGGERGLLGLAFAPDYPTSGRFYVNYTDNQGDTVVARYRVSQEDPGRADPASAQVLLRIEQPFSNHNGGWMGFGPDGYLYIAVGDGGSANDPLGAGQDLGTLLGKMLRVDVSGDTPAIPPDNPFTATLGARPEIWAYGLRNPWRASFDRETGALWIADVGQNNIEEVNVQPDGAAGGRNYGWQILEGSQCTTPGCSSAGTVLPVDEYTHDLGCSVTGGYVYRGSRYPALRGKYLFGDFCSGRVFALTSNGNGAYSRQELAATGLPIASFGEDQAGELYLVALSGSIFHVSDGEPLLGPIIDGTFTGTWYDPAQSGHGLFVEVLPGNQVLAYWFTFDADGRQAWFGGVGPIQGNRAVLQTIRAEHGRFIPDFDPAEIQYTEFGTLTLQFDSCREGEVQFNLPGTFGTGTMRLVRLTEPVGTACATTLSKLRPIVRK